MKLTATFFLSLLCAVSCDARAEPPREAASTMTSPEATISIRDFAFSPTSVTITVGSAVRWKNLDGEPHTVRSVDNDFRSDPLDQNDSFVHTFNKPGTYRYVCSIHPRMIGTIEVRSASGQ